MTGVTQSFYNNPIETPVGVLKRELGKDLESIRLKYLISTPITHGSHLTPKFTHEGFPFLSVDGIQNGELTFEECRFIGEEDHRKFRKKATPQLDDILFGKPASTGKIARVKTEKEFSIRSPIALIRPNQKVILSIFLEYVLKSPLLQTQIDDLCGLNIQRRFSMGAILNLFVPFTSLENQKRIAQYLERETLKNDALVADKKSMLELLKEKHKALISQVLTHGLDANIPLKPSGLDWLGKIPQHWRVERAKRLFYEVDERTTTGEEELLSLRMNVGLVPHDDVSDKKIDPKDVIGFKRVKAGQLVINRMRASMGLIAVASQPGLVSPDYAVFDIIKPVHMPYFLTLFNTSLVGSLFLSASKGIGTGSQGFLRLHIDNFLALHFPVPPLAEQKEIMDYLNDEWERTSELSELLTRSILLLKERRSALITAGVTGKIKLEELM